MSLSLFVIGREKAFGEYRCDGKNQVMCELCGNKEIEKASECVNDIFNFKSSIYLSWDNSGNEYCTSINEDTPEVRNVLLNDRERLRLNVSLAALKDSIKGKKNLKEFREQLDKLPSDEEMFYYVAIS